MKNVMNQICHKYCMMRNCARQTQVSLLPALVPLKNDRQGHGYKCHYTLSDSDTFPFVLSAYRLSFILTFTFFCNGSPKQYLSQPQEVPELGLQVSQEEDYNSTLKKYFTQEFISLSVTRSIYEVKALQLSVFHDCDKMSEKPKRGKSTASHLTFSNDDPPLMVQLPPSSTTCWQPVLNYMSLGALWH